MFEGIIFIFKVVDDFVMVNVFVMLGGYIYVYSGLFFEVESEVEVIGVFGYEVVYVM